MRQSNTSCTSGACQARKGCETWGTEAGCLTRTLHCITGLVGSWTRDTFKLYSSTTRFHVLLVLSAPISAGLFALSPWSQDASAYLVKSLHVHSVHVDGAHTLHDRFRSSKRVFRSCHAVTGPLSSWHQPSAAFRVQLADRDWSASLWEHRSPIRAGIKAHALRSFKSAVEFAINHYTTKGCGRPCLSAVTFERTCFDFCKVDFLL